MFVTSCQGPYHPSIILDTDTMQHITDWVLGVLYDVSNFYTVVVMCKLCKRIWPPSTYTMQKQGGPGLKQTVGPNLQGGVLSGMSYRDSGYPYISDPALNQCFMRCF